jgi:NAD(P)-dependent dehydrogenase (short-subunit alcohol dehydrogenase family)
MWMTPTVSLVRWSPRPATGSSEVVRVGRLDGKVALITGAASGMGKVAATLFAAEGASVVVADVADQAGQATAQEIQATGGRSAYVRADVSKAAEAEAMIRAAVDAFGGLHVLYNNAGIFPSDDGSVTETPEETWDRVMAINLKGVFMGCKYGIPAMLESGGGSIINVASFVALMGAAAPQIAYTTSKGGVLSMTREIAVDFARRNIRANALCPGPIETPLLAELMADPVRRQRRLVHIPVGRLGQAHEIANAALFLASDESSFITGSTFVVDGGITAAYLTPE